MRHAKPQVCVGFFVWVHTDTPGSHVLSPGWGLRRDAVLV